MNEDMKRGYKRFHDLPANSLKSVYDIEFSIYIKLKLLDKHPSTRAISPVPSCYVYLFFLHNAMCCEDELYFNLIAYILFPILPIFQYSITKIIVLLTFL
jgi:hypothetical protein